MATKKAKPAAKQKPAAAKKKPAAKKRPAAKQKVSPAALALHRKALRHHWDSGPPHRLVAARDCDYGTALAVYWMGAPGFDQEFATEDACSDWRRPTFRFLRALEKRLLARDFKTAGILFNPQFDRTTISDEGHDWTAEYADVNVVRPIPEELKLPSTDDPAWEARGAQPIENTANRLT